MSVGRCDYPTLQEPFFYQDEARKNVTVFHPELPSVLRFRSAARQSGLHLGRRIARQLSAPIIHQPLRLTPRYEGQRSPFILAKKRTA